MMVFRCETKINDTIEAYQLADAFITSNRTLKTVGGYHELWAGWSTVPKGHRDI